MTGKWITTLHRYAVPIAWSALAWAIVTGVIRYYWFFGGRVGLGTLARQVQVALTDAESDIPSPDFGYEGMLLLVLALIILVTLRPWGEDVPQALLFGMLYVVSVWLVLYGLAGWIAELLMVTGVRDIPAGLGRGPMWWHFLLWDPWWMLGGVLTFLTADACRRRWLPGTT